MVDEYNMVEIKMTDKEVISYLVENNKSKHNLLKAAEELSELALALLQKVNKENVNDNNIVEEMGHVKIRLAVLDELFNKQDVQESIDSKLSKFRKYIKEDKYKGKM